MDDSAPSQLPTHPAFAGLSDSSAERLQQQLSRRQFAVGDPLCLRGLIPSEILLLQSGTARLLVRDQGRLRTAEKLGPGSFVGLASLLRAAPCEEVSAGSEVEALVLADSLILELLASEPSFAQWCGSNLFTAELAALLALLLEQHPQAGTSLQELLDQARPQARLVPPEPSALAALPIDFSLLAASHNLIDHPLGAALNPRQGVPAATPPLPPRLIALPAELLAPVAPVLEAELMPEGSGSSGQPGGSNPPLASALDLGQRDRTALQLLRGNGPLEETLACFQMLAAELKLPFRRDAIEKILRDVLRRGQTPDLQLCGNLAAMMGLHVSGVRVPAIQGTRLQTPALIPWQGGFAVVRGSNARGLLLASPREGWVELSPDQLPEAFPDGIDVLLLERSSATPEQRFGFAWFWPALQRYRGILTQVLIASFVVQLFSLANPLLIQVIIDKVINQRSLDTLQVLGFALVVVTLMEGLIGALRTFLFSETTNRIDLRLGAEVIDHLLRLPLNYFDRRPVGELGTRIAELEKIRNFLTGQALTTLLDTAFSVIYIAVMLIYSWLLTLIALCVLPIQIGLTVLGAPLFRRQYRDAAQENARTQSHLVEVLTGIQTVKAQNVEMISRWKWQDFYGKYISRTFEKTITGTALNETSQVLQKLSQLLVLWVGASLVLSGDMTLGQLIAFRIISGYVTQPLLRLSSIWQSIQELKVSFERLADVVDTPEESDEADKQKIPLPPIAGEVRFDDLCFSFTPGGTQVLRHIDFTIAAGTFVGVVGQSGSGKSTLTKMLARLYSPGSGRILIDNYDIDKVELYSLRRQIGIVPQEPLLFTGTVAENIALTDPDASSDSIVQAARLACAHDFIMELPAGYSSTVGERGAGLSGGQRQRLALARTLLSQPRLLVLDEATSALDYDTERRVCDNLLDNLKHCTVFFITHRLSTIRRAELIVMMHEGAIVETGTHDELMERRGRYYALYRQQEVN
ncbi:peptidase domain-containing ABC transporter [Cyanobium sp. Maggiore-St4-Cus]|uniref:ABC transporter transmembrane domain-containing protein n=1 Tax=Cyanobium sp. Maggiore-St4-Cus TaxID=2823717 RepID=UPI0020CF67D4|nr:peptidase domain-containing ABC transporter [Cyanobium sp. Maggiore-St4-Cus]MCP9788373.1 peptidase domain-containing ABC transporter [Cyanobium sp. Maggiore-St4-Cus]